MTTVFVMLVWLGGVYGAEDAGRGTWWGVFWPFHVARQIVRKAHAGRKEGSDGSRRNPADAKAALEAYGREKVREGMQRAADIAYAGKNSAATSDHRGQIKRTILAEMETLK